MKIVKYPHPAHAGCPAVTAIDGEIQAAAARMLDLMYTSEGLGLAAPADRTAGSTARHELRGDPEKKESEFVAINPVIVESEGSVNDREGCLSFPGLYKRPPRQDREGAGLQPQGRTVRDGLPRLARPGLAARDRPPRRRALHRQDGFLGLHRSQKDLDKFIADFEKDKKKGDLPADLIPKL